MTINAVIFDLDGVLVDACEIHYQALNAALRQVVGYEIPREEHESAYNGLPTKEKLKILEEKQIIQEDQKAQIDRVKQSLTMYFIEALRPDEQKIELLEWLKDKGIALGCVTNCTRESAIKMLTIAGLVGFFDEIITSSDGYRPKPDPQAYVECMKLMGVQKRFTMIVEDSPKGCEAATLAGVRVLRAINDGPKEVIKDIFTGYV